MLVPPFWGWVSHQWEGGTREEEAECEGLGGPFGVIPGSAGLLAAPRGSDGRERFGETPELGRARPWRLTVRELSLIHI